MRHRMAEYKWLETAELGTLPPNRKLIEERSWLM